MVVLRMRLLSNELGKWPPRCFAGPHISQFGFRICNKVWMGMLNICVLCHRNCLDFSCQVSLWFDRIYPTLMAPDTQWYQWLEDDISLTFPFGMVYFQEGAVGFRVVYPPRFCGQVVGCGTSLTFGGITATLRWWSCFDEIVRAAQEVLWEAVMLLGSRLFVWKSWQV